MEYLVTLQSIAQNLFSTLQSSELEQFCSVWGYKSELDKLQTTANKVKALLHDAERSLQQGHIELSEQDQLFVEDLKHLVYDTEDLLQTILTLAEQRQLRAQEDEGDNIITKFRRFFSFEENPLVVAIRGYRGVKEIENRLDEITLSHNRLNLKKGDLNFQPIHWRREETDSCAYAHEIIGRDDDIDKIVGVLLDPNVQGNVSYYCIVGMGGLGKTAVANKVYNDPRLRGKFSLKLWVCVSDENPDCLDLKATLHKILKSIVTDNCDHFSLEQLQTEVRKRLEGKKYLLILDDVWNENREQWLKLEKYFQGGIKGSWILVTTRSEKTAKIVAGDEHIHKLKGLSNDDSWCLFESLAFEQRSEQGCDPDLVEIGKRIVKKCANVPLAIRVVGSLLYGQGKQRWLTFEAIQLGGIKEGGNGGIKAILELSYFHLPTALKICFTYCALFPKDYRIDKEMLINLWRAQGFVIPQYEVQTLEDASEEYFSILASRSFFQDISKRSDGKVSFTLHDLMHDIARGVVGKEIHAIDSGDPFPSSLNERTRHLYLSTGFVDTQSFFTGTKIRTFLQMKKSNQYHHASLWCHSDQHLSTLLANWVYLRALDLSGTGIKDLPSTVGKLELLRYLDLSRNEDLKELPDSITGLHNLEILLLSECHWLEKLPEELSKLTKLRVLDTLACYALQYMPRHMGRLTCLEKLPWYVVGDRSSCKQQRGLVDQLQELKALKNIKGELCIMLHSLEGPTFAMEDGGERGYLSEHQYLTKIKFDIFPREFNEALLEDLRPHCKLVELELRGIGRERMPNWAREDNLTVFLPNLTNLTLDQCDRLRHLSGIGKLPKLKSLILENLSNLEYIETTRINSNSSGVEALESQELFFPCLECLKLSSLEKLRGWWRDDDSSNQQDGGLLPSFPRLTHLKMEKCSMLASMPYCPGLEDLQIKDYNANLRIMESMELGNSKLKRIETSDVVNLKLILPMGAFQCLQRMVLSKDEKVESLSDVGEMLLTCSSSLQYLHIKYCSALKSVSGGLKHLTALETLTLRGLRKLSLSKEEGEEEEIQGMPWRCLAHSLRSLTLSYLPEVEKLPNGMKYLTALQSLKIGLCKKLEGVPEWIPELTSLKTLEINNCSGRLLERCRNSTGEDWPYIRHIPNIIIRGS